MNTERKTIFQELTERKINLAAHLIYRDKSSPTILFRNTIDDMMSHSYNTMVKHVLNVLDSPVEVAEEETYKSQKHTPTEDMLWQVWKDIVVPTNSFEPLSDKFMEAHNRLKEFINSNAAAAKDSYERSLMDFFKFLHQENEARKSAQSKQEVNHDTRHRKTPNQK